MTKKKKMKKGMKYGIIAVITVLVLGAAAVFATNGEIFQGRFSLKLFEKPIASQFQDKPYYNYDNTMVSPVVSPVPSIVPSEVPSEVNSTVVSDGGPSQVPSEVPSVVPSVVVSPIASSVPVPKKLQKGIKLKDLPTLTAKILLDAAKNEFKKNPAQFKLSPREKKNIIKLYEYEQKCDAIQELK